MNIKDINLTHLQRSHLIDLGAVDGLGMLELVKDGKITLDDVLDKATGANKISNSISALLRFYSIAEIACIISFISEPEPNVHEFWRDTLRILLIPGLRRIHGDFFPLLPFLRLRLQGKLSLKEHNIEGTANVFLSFLSMMKQFRKDHEIALFLRLVSSPENRVDGTQLGSLRVLLRNSKEVIDRAIKPQEECEPIDRALHGFEKFLQFCADFDKLLQDSKDRPLMQSAMWAYCADVFEAAGKNIRSIVEESSAIFETWSENSVQAAAAYRKEVVVLIERLTSGRYKAYLAAQDYPGEYRIHKTQGIKNIYVGNFSFAMTESELRSLFEPFGTVESVTLVTDRDTGRSRGFGFVSMLHSDEAESAIASLNGKESGGRALIVNEARTQTQRAVRRRDRQDDYSPRPRPPREVS